MPQFKHGSDKDEVLFIVPGIDYTRRMFESDFEVDGSYRQIWSYSRSKTALDDFFNALRKLGVNWNVSDMGHPSEQEYWASPESSPLIRISLAAGIALHAYCWDAELGEIEANIDPTEITEENCPHVFRFIRSIGQILGLTIYFGEESREYNLPDAPEDHAIFSYDAHADSFRRLSPPIESSQPVRIF